jgi:ArsR family transcriptional regulator
MFSPGQSVRITSLFRLLSDPFRVRLLLVLSEQEACVCHLECLLGKRQAYISQHLMNLREAGILIARREGKYIFYRLKDNRLLNLIHRAAEITGSKLASTHIEQSNALSKCVCPSCAPTNPVPLQ